MQNIAPKVKAIQEQYKGRDQQEMQIKVGELYKQAGVNPLAGCLPTLATLPVWIGLYRYACCPLLFCSTQKQVHMSKLGRNAVRANGCGGGPPSIIPALFATSEVISPPKCHIVSSTAVSAHLVSA